MFSLFQTLSVLFALLVILCAYIGRKVYLQNGDLPFGFKETIENTANKGVISFVSVWLCYALIGFTKLFDICTTVFQKSEKSDPNRKD